MEISARCLKGCIFPVPEEVICSFFNIFFNIFCAKYKFGLSIKTWGRGCGCSRLSFYHLKRVSHCSGFFCYAIAYLVQFWVIKNRVTKISFKYFNGNCYYSSCPGWSILFFHVPSANKALAFWKKYLLI